jgi:hypothetical protein
MAENIPGGLHPCRACFRFFRHGKDKCAGRKKTNKTSTNSTMDKRYRNKSGKEKRTKKENKGMGFAHISFGWGLLRHKHKGNLF